MLLRVNGLTNLSSLLFNSALSRKQIGLTSMLGVYVVLGVGIVMSFMALIVEIYWKRRVKQKLIKKLQRWVTK